MNEGIDGAFDTDVGYEMNVESWFRIRFKSSANHHWTKIRSTYSIPIPTTIIIITIIEII